MNIYDCFTYFDEDLILDLRFNILDKYVDKFIIVESTHDHSGNKKKLNFQIDKYKNFKSKIYYYVVRDMPKGNLHFKNNWSPNFVRENYQRNAIQHCLENCNDKDMILISDADEIPSLNFLGKIKINKYALFSQMFFMYKLNLLNNWNWLGSGICYFKYLESPQWLRNKRFLRRGFLRRLFKKTQIIQNGGWHFSYLKSPDDIMKKIKSFAHGEHSRIQISYIIDQINSRKQLFSSESDKKMQVLEINKKFFPPYIVDNQEKLKDWIIKL